MKNVEYFGVELTKSTLIQNICMAAASEYVDDVAVEAIDENLANGYRITLEIKGLGYCTPLDHALANRISAMLSMVNAYKKGQLPQTVFETAFRGVQDIYMKNEYEEHLLALNTLKKIKKEWEDWCNQPLNERKSTPWSSNT